MSDRKGWGGPRPGSGRRPTGQALRSLTVRLSPEHIEHLRQLGEGNASEGVRRLVQRADQENRLANRLDETTDENIRLREELRRLRKQTPPPDGHLNSL